MKKCATLIQIALLVVFGVLTNVNAQAARTTTMELEAPQAFYFGAGVGVLDNLGEQVRNDPSYSFYGGRLWNLNRYVSMKTTLEAATDFDNAVLASALVGANVYPIRARYSPYLGGGIGVGYARAEDETDKFGLDISGVFGIMLLRGSPIEAKIETNANVLLREIDENDNFPLTFGVRAAALF
jgi:hypothetical protein